jgi:hypothetical protein
VESFFRSCHVHSSGAVIGSCVALAEVVSLDGVVVSANLLLLKVSNDEVSIQIYPRQFSPSQSRQGRQTPTQ